MTQQKHIDTATVEMLVEILEDGFPTLIDTFINDSQLRIHEIKAGFASGDAEAIRRAAHSLKGSSGNVGAVRLAELSQALELAAKNGDLPDPPFTLSQIEAEFSAVRDGLAHWLVAPN